jgi:hypothetical protein
MPERISKVLNVSHAALDSAGVFDRFVDIDSALHVDPHLLRASDASELREAAEKMDVYWRDTILILSNIFDHGDRFWRAALVRFTFPENTHAALGYASDSVLGSAIGPGLASKLVATAQQIVRAGVTDTKVFDLVGLLEPDVGPDRISDITVHIIEPQLLTYTARICRDLGIKTAKVTIRGATYDLPVNPTDKHYLILFPKDILRELPVAFCWDEIDKVCVYNEALRTRMNAIIGENWKQATRDNGKEKLKSVLLQNPDALADMIRQYREKPTKPYDFAKDVLGETIWLERSREVAEQFPLAIKTEGEMTPKKALDVVRQICDHFRKLVEDNGLCRIFWTDDGEIRHERFAQLLFFGIADAYCKANNLDLSPEANSGRGPVDFKFSKGYDNRVLIEAKWSKNPKLVHGLETQIEQYGKAEQTNALILLVIQVTPTRKSIDRLLEVQGEAIRAGKRAPEIKVVDGRMKDSASHFDRNR